MTLTKAPRILLICTALAAALSLAAWGVARANSSPMPPSGEEASTSLIGHWVFNGGQLSGAPIVPGDTLAWVEFAQAPDGLAVSGFNGCNSLRGTATEAPGGGSVTFGALMTTKMACSGPGSDLEWAFMRALEGQMTASVSRRDSETILSLNGPSGASLEFSLSVPVN